MPVANGEFAMRGRDESRPVGSAFVNGVTLRTRDAVMRLETVRCASAAEEQKENGPGPCGPGPSCVPYAYERVTVYCPHAVKATVTVVVVPFLVTITLIVPASNRGAIVHDALKCRGGLVLTLRDDVWSPRVNV